MEENFYVFTTPPPACLPLSPHILLPLDGHHEPSVLCRSLLPSPHTLFYLLYTHTHTHTHTYIGHAVRHVGFYFSHCCSVAKGCLTLCNPMDCSVPSFPVLYHLPGLLKLMSIESVMISNHFILCHPLLLLPSIFPSIRVFSNESALHIRWQGIGASAVASVLPMNIQG